MKKLFFTMLLVILFVPGVVHAGVCPTRANSLEEFRSCMTPMRGTIGTAAVYSSGQYDEAHRKLISAMMRSDGVPPQVIPAGGISYPWFAAYNPYFTMANAYMYGLFRLNTPYAMNPYYFGYGH